MVRFLHSADWQLGMRRHFLDADAQARFGEARIEAIRSAGAVATANDCAFMVVAGDVFESNHIDRRTTLRALDALASVPCPVFLLPGNHDPLDASSVYASPAFVQACPAHVRVLATNERHPAAPGVDVVGVPWPSKKPATDLVAAVLAGLEAQPGRQVVLVAHGAVSDGRFGPPAAARAPGPGPVPPGAMSSNAISLSVLEEAVTTGRLAYVALGDRHSTTSVGRSGRVWYSGAPEPTDFDEVDPGNVLVVELSDDGSCTVTPQRVATWTYWRDEIELASDADLDRLEAVMAGLPRKERTIARLGLRGTLTLRQQARLDAVLDSASETLAALDRWAATDDLAVMPDASDVAHLGISGFARAALDALLAASEPDAAGPTAFHADCEVVVARDALGLLYRLAS